LSPIILTINAGVPIMTVHSDQFSIVSPELQSDDCVSGHAATGPLMCSGASRRYRHPVDMSAVEGRGRPGGVRPS